MYTVKVTVIPAVNCRPCVSCTSWVNILAEIRFLEATENLLWEGGVRGEDMERNEIFMPVWAVDPWLRMKRGSRLSLEMGPTVMMKREGSQGFHCTSCPWVFICGLSFNHPLAPTQISLPQLGLAFHIQTFTLNGHRHFVSHWYLKLKTTETELFIFRYGSLSSPMFLVLGQWHSVIRIHPVIRITGVFESPIFHFPIVQPTVPSTNSTFKLVNFTTLFSYLSILASTALAHVLIIFFFLN